MEFKKEILLTEEECGQVADLLIGKANRCEANAKNCLSGYGKATSSFKAQEWRAKADNLIELANKLSEPWI